MIAEVINNEELSGGVEPKEVDGPSSDAMKMKNNKMNLVENGKIKEKGLDHNESGSADESIERKNVETSLLLYVGGIPDYFTEDDIRSYFERFGIIIYVDCMIFPDDGKFRAFAIITYKTEAAAKKALALDGFDLGGVFLKIQPYKSATVNKLPKFSPSLVDGYNRICIGNLSWDTTEVDLWKLFANCAVTSIQFGEDKGEFKRYAHVDFADALSLHMALKLDQTIVHGRPVRISFLVPKKATGTRLMFLPKDNQEDSGKKENTTNFSTPKVNEVDKSSVSAIENQVTSTGTNDFGSKTLWLTYDECRERGHLSSACPKKLAANSTIPWQMTVSSEKKGFGTALIPMPKDNQEDIEKKQKFTKFEATPGDHEIGRSNVFFGVTLAPLPKDNQDDIMKKRFTKLHAAPRDHEIDRSTVIFGQIDGSSTSLVVENQVTTSGTNNVSSTARWLTCDECREHGHLSSACPKKLAADSTIPGQMIVSSETEGSGPVLIPWPKDNQEDIWRKRQFTKFEATPRDHEIDRSTVFFGVTLTPLPKDNQDDIMNKRFTKLEATPRDHETNRRTVIFGQADRNTVSVGVENQVTSTGTNEVGSATWWLTCDECRVRGHLSTACPKKLACDSTIPGQVVVSSEEKRSGTTLIHLPKDNQEDIGKKRKFTQFEATLKDHETDQSTAFFGTTLVTLPNDNKEDIGKRQKFTKFEGTPRDHEIDSSTFVLGTTLIPLPKDNQEDIGKKLFTKFEATPRDQEIDQSTVIFGQTDRSNISVVVENQVTSSGSNALRSRIRKLFCRKCKERGHFKSSCPKKLAGNSTNPGNHVNSGKGKFTEVEATPTDNEVDRSNASVVKNKVTSNGSHALRLKIWKSSCGKCKERGHFKSSCPKILAANSTNPGNRVDSGKGNFTKVETTPGDNEVDRSKVSVVVENQVTSSVSNALRSKIQKPSCPDKLAADSTLSVTGGKLTPSIECIPVGATSGHRSLKPMLVRWLPPPNPWFKLNTDGGFDTQTGAACGGGVIRDHLGNLQLAFYMPLEATSSMDAELQALLHGLYVARRFNRPIWCELDALEVVRLLETGRAGTDEMHNTLTSIRVLMTQMKTWITHIFREGNQAADYMAKMGVGSHALHLVYPRSAPEYFRWLITMDQIGYPTFRAK